MTKTALLVSVAIPLAVGAIAGLATRHKVSSTWYNSLEKPSWTPPRQVFGPVWTALYILMGVACWRVWKAGGRSEPMTLYGIQLGLNLAWSLLFFNAQSLKWALFDILALLGVLVATTMSFYKVDKMAGYLMMPYLAWVAYATTLTAGLYYKN